MSQVQAQWCSNRRALVGLVLLNAVVTSLSGCGGGGSSTPKTTVAGSSKAQGSQAESATGEESTSANPNVRTDAGGRKWIGDIPWDVFFNDPLAVASVNTPVGGAPDPAPLGNMTKPDGSPAVPTSLAPAAEATPAGATDWKSLITMEQIGDETKRIRNHLTASLQSVGTYNGGYKELQIDGAVIAALAEVVSQHSEEVSWKSNSRFLREYGTQLRQAAQALGRENYTSSQAAAEGIEAVLAGNVPANAGDPPATKPLGEAANRAGVMQRISKASEWMRSNINAESVFNKELDEIRQESAILAALAKVIADPSYDSATEGDYAGWAKDLLEAARAVGASTEDKAYPKFQDSMNKIKKACDSCHLNYGNG